MPIFWRLMLSHFGIMLLSGSAWVYSIVQLGSLSGTAQIALDTDHRMISYQEALTEAFLSQVRYGGKYLITHTNVRHEQLREFKKDFIDYLERLKQMRQSESVGPSFSTIERFHGQYHELFDREVEYIRAKQDYAQTRFQQERDMIVESSLNELDGLKVQLRTKLQEKLESIDQGARTARRIAILTMLAVFILAGALSLRVSGSIDSPRGEQIVARPPVSPSFQSIKLAGSRFAAYTGSAAKLQSNRFTASALGLLAASSRRCLSWRNPTPGKGN